MLRVLAVDDEVPQLEELLYLLRRDGRVSSVEGATNAVDALRVIRHGVDVVFLDIHMPGMTGLDLARALADPDGEPGGQSASPLIVFVTAHEDFAVQAFDLEAVDYVLKPVRANRLAEAVRRAAELRDARTGGVPGEPGGATDQVPVELGGVTRFVAVTDITYVEAQGDYARLHTGRTSHLVRIPLATLEERWRSRGFVRIHRSHLVALGRIDELRLEAGGMSVRVGDAVLAVSRRHAKELRDRLVRHAGG